VGPEARACILDEAASWYGTPYHQGGCSIKGVGVDCGRFVYEVFKNFYHIPPFPTSYAEDWANHRRNELFLNWLEPVAIRTQILLPGTVSIFKFGRNFSHAGIFLGDNRYIHCWGKTGQGGVIISPITWFFTSQRNLREFVNWEMDDQWLLKKVAQDSM
jgi:cell wall-associated NlpC family hydrolase